MQLEINKMHTNTVNNPLALTEGSLASSPSLYHTTASNYSDQSMLDVANPLIQYFSNSNQCPNLSANYSGSANPQKTSLPAYSNLTYNNPSSSSSSSSCSSSSDTLTDLDFLLTSNNTSNTGTRTNTTTAQSQRRFSTTGSHINMKNLTSNITTPTTIQQTTYHYTDQYHHQQQGNQTYLCGSNSNLQSTPSLTETNPHLASQNCLMNSSEFTALNPVVSNMCNINESFTNLNKGSLDLTSDLDSILLDTNIINTNTANYFIESMQAIQNLDSNQNTCLDLSNNSMSNLGTQGNAHNIKSQTALNRINNSSACSSSSASSSTTSSSVVNNSMDTFEAMVTTSLDSIATRYDQNSETAPTQMSQSYLTDKSQSYNIDRYRTLKNNTSIDSNSKLKQNAWDYDKYSTSTGRKRNFNSNGRYSSVHSDYSDSALSYSMPSTPNVSGYTAQSESGKRFKYDNIKQDMSEVNLEAAVSYPKYKRYDEFKCWVCGDQSSGNHYGALTCEACKLFFRRHSTAITSSLSNNASSPSSNNSSSSNEPKILTQCAQRNCQITVQTRSSCPECRYRKCIAVGMGLNRTTFGRHTTVQKVRYNTRVTDLFAEIMKLFLQLKDKLNMPSVHKSNSDAYLIPNNISLAAINQTTANLKIIENKSELESNLLNFYNEVIDLMTPIQGPSKAESNKNDSKSHRLQMPTNVNNNILNFASMSKNTLIAFCLIFGYNLKVSTTNCDNTPMNSYQIQHICKQIKEIDDQFSNFAMRIKIIYFLLIMYTSHSANAIYDQEIPTAADCQAFQFQQQTSSFQCLNQYQAANNPTTYNSSYNSYLPLTGTTGQTVPKANCFDEFIEDTSNIQRTFLDLLNSELDFQQNTVSATRVSLLLKLDQFI